MSTATRAPRGAAVPFVPPPMYYAAGLVGGLAIDRVRPLPIGLRPAAPTAGAVLVALGLALALAGVAAVVRHRTTLVPHHAVSTLVTGGAYRLSRNPMYTGLAAAFLGLALLLGSWWPVLLWPLAVVAVRRLVIRPEEQYLAERFGQAYTDYRARVRRWL
jgi:protein-S-isoprenylcysteine O-methyltransferase Ste14